MAKFREYQGDERFLDLRDHNMRARALNALSKNLPINATMGPNGEVMTRRQPDSSPTMFDAEITETAQLGSGSDEYQWLYTIREVTVTPTTDSSGNIDGFTITTVTGGRTGKAINMAEIRNQDTSGIAFGVDQSSSLYPSGFAPRPITSDGLSNTHAINQIVPIIGSLLADDGTTVYKFDRMGLHWGTC